nr:hypothetical protein [Tanacetum cinerariifolium]
MVACLERTDGNAEFYQIVGFFTSSPIHYALTFGTVTSLFDTMLVPPVVKGEGSGQPFEPQPPSSTALLEQVLAIVGDEVVYTGEDDKVVRAPTIAASLEAEHESGNINKTRSTTTLNEPSPQGTGSGNGPKRHVTTLGDTDAQTRFKTTSKQSHDPPLSEVNTSLSREDSMEHQDDLTDCVPPTPHDSPLLGGHILGSDEDRPNINELMNICTQLSNRELNLSDKGSGETEVFNYTTVAKKDVDGVEPVSTAGDAVNPASVILDVSAAGPSTSTAGDIFKDEMTTIADTLMAIRSTRPRTTSVVIHNVEEETRRATPQPTVQSQDKGKGKMVEPKPTLKNPIKAQIQRDAEIAQRLFEEEQAQFEREQRIAREKATEQEAKDAVLIEQNERCSSKDGCRCKYTHNQLKSKSFEEIQMLYEREQKWINDFVLMNSKVVNDSEQQAKCSKKRSRANHDNESVKKQKLEEDDMSINRN